MKDIIKKLEDLIDGIKEERNYLSKWLLVGNNPVEKIAYIQLVDKNKQLESELSVLKSKMEEVTEVTDEDIEKAFPSDLRTLCTQLKIPESLWSSELSDALKSIQEGNLNKQIGAKAHRDNLIKKGE